MSHAWGAIRFDVDGQVFFYEYNGTSDFCCPKLYPTMKALRDEWRKGEWLECNCGRAEPVVIYSAYTESAWHGRACRYCGAITDGRSPYGDIDTGLDRPRTYRGDLSWCGKTRERGES